VVENASGEFADLVSALDAEGWGSWVTLIDAPINGGFAYGNNLGIQRALDEYHTPDYVYLLNPDTEIRAGAIKSLVEFLEDRPSVGIAGSSIENPDGTAWPIAFRFPGLLSELSAGIQLNALSRILHRWEVAQEMENRAASVDWVCGASMMIRTQLINTIGGLDENYFLYYEETDFCRRARLAGFSTWYVPQSRIMHIAGQSTKVTERGVAPRRLPHYWFASRRRYFVVHHGLYKAMLIDAVAILAHAVGRCKRLLQGRRDGTPFFLRDLLKNSVLFPQNRAVTPLRTFKPGRAAKN
jgi:GT2 family glycosyltransferase